MLAASVSVAVDGYISQRGTRSETCSLPRIRRGDGSDSCSSITQEGPMPEGPLLRKMDFSTSKIELLVVAPSCRKELNGLLSINAG